MEALAPGRLLAAVAPTQHGGKGGSALAAVRDPMRRLQSLSLAAVLAAAVSRPLRPKPDDGYRGPRPPTGKQLTRTQYKNGKARHKK